MRLPWYRRRRIARLWQWVARPVAAIAEFVGQWLRTRPRPLLFWSSLAIVVAVAVGLVILWLSQKPEGALADRYKVAAWRAIARKDYAAADLYLRKVLQLTPGDSEARFRLAFVAAESGDRARADRLIAELAPHEGVGFPQAHFAVATSRLRAQENWTSEQLQQVAHHLEAAARDIGLRADAQQLLGQLYLAQRDFEKAIACFQSIAGQRPEMRLAIAQLQAANNRPVEAQNELTKAVSELQNRVTAQPANEHTRVTLARALQMSGEMAEAEKVLVEGLRQAENERCREALAVLYVGTLQRMPRRADNADLMPRVELLHRAISYAPQAPVVVQCLAELCGLDAGAMNPLTLPSPAEGRGGELARSGERGGSVEGKVKRAEVRSEERAENPLTLPLESEERAMNPLTLPSPAEGRGGESARSGERGSEVRSGERDGSEAMTSIALTAAPSREDLEKALKDLLAAGRATPTVHLMLGILNAVDGNQERAGVHLTQAYRLDPRVAQVMQGLINLLLERQPPSRVQAAALAEAAAAAWPGE